MRHLRAVGLALVLVLAGCAAAPTSGVPEGDRPPATTAPATTGNASQGGAGSSIAVRGGSLPVDPGGAFGRLQDLAGTDVAPPGYVRVVPESRLPSRNGSERDGNESEANESERGPTSFWSVMGVVPEPDRRERLRYRYPARTGLTGVVSIYPGAKPPELVETILVHEFVHYLQFRKRHGVQLRRTLPRTTDGSFVYRSVLEGTAVALTDRYVQRHLPNASSNSQLYRRIARAVPEGTPAWYGNAQYYFGSRYVSARLSAPTAFESVVRRPPTTSEQVLHGYGRGVEPPRNLSVELRTGDEWRSVGDDVLGEAFLRVALQNGLERDRARRAAAGWGNDRLEILRPTGGGDPAFAWVIRWDDRENATEFADALDRTLATRGNRSGESFRIDGRTYDLRRPTGETTVLLVGNETFVGNATVTARGPSVEVVVSGDEV